MHAAAREGQAFTLCHIDLDDFKSINDHRGRHVGDAVFRNVAAILTRCSRQTDHVARFGGEEFLMLFPHTDLSKAHTIIDRMQTSLSASGSVDMPAVRCRIGVITFKKMPESASNVIRRVDELMYGVKK